MGLSYTSFFLLLILLFGYKVKAASGGRLVKSLPGYGVLPFALETGYIGVGDNEEVQLFYYFVQSQNASDPILLWINGGPGCSSLASFFFEIGPLSLDIDNYNGGLPRLLPNAYSWTKSLNIIFLDAPVGTGFSYLKTTEGYATSDSKFSANMYEFVRKWFNDHQSFSQNDLYLGGEGYSGNPIPIVIQDILTGSAAQPINVKGYIMGNPGTDLDIDFNSRVPVAHRLALVSDELFEEASESCNGTFFPPPSDPACVKALNEINELLCYINPTQILDPACATECLTSTSSTSSQSNQDSKSTSSLSSLPKSFNKQCPDYSQSICEIWANNIEVQESLYVEQGTVSYWSYCNDTLNSVYSHDISSVLEYHQNFTNTNLRGLIYSGDHDTGIPYIGTQQWIKSLNMPLEDAWRAWNVSDEVAGYTRKFVNGSFSLTYATVKGAGHFAAEFKAQCSAMMGRWMAYEPL